MSAVCDGRRMDTYISADLSHECCLPKPRRQWFMHSSHRVLTTVTRCCSAPVTICSGVFRPYKMRPNVLLLVPDVVSTSCPSWGNFIGWQCDSALNSSRQFCCTKRWMACLHNIWRMTASLAYTSTAGRRRLRSSNVATREVPRTRTSLGDRSFTVAGPRLWNNLPPHLRNSEHTRSPSVPPVTEDALVLLRTAAPIVTVCFLCAL